MGKWYRRDHIQNSKEIHYGSFAGAVISADLIPTLENWKTMRCSIDMNIPALDLTNEFPRSPRDTSIAGYVIAARALDKCRAVLADTAGEYHSGCPLDEFWFDFAGIDYEAFKEFVATGADDKSVSQWVSEHAKHHEPTDLIAWNNTMRDKRISEMPINLQEFLENYIPENIPENKRVYVWFDVYDIEEKRI